MGRALARVRTVASIGTLHPWNIAGAGLDVRASRELGVRVVTALAAVSAQDGQGARGVYALEPQAFRAQLEALPWSHVEAVRVGALPNAAAHAILRDVLRDRELPIVVDPVLVASNGVPLCDEGTLAAVAAWLDDARAVVTPNRPEARALLGHDIEQPELAARELVARGARAVVLKGGHSDGAEVVDIVATALEAFVVRSPRLAVDMRGTGCLFAFSLAASLASKHTLYDAVCDAHAFVHGAIAKARTFAGFDIAY